MQPVTRLPDISVSPRAHIVFNHLLPWSCYLKLQPFSYHLERARIGQIVAAVFVTLAIVCQVWRTSSKVSVVA